MRDGGDQAILLKFLLADVMEQVPAFAEAEKKMFGGLCFFLNGNMLCGVEVGRYMFRVGKVQESDALEKPCASPMDLTGRPMGGLVHVTEDGCCGDNLIWFHDLYATWGAFTRTEPIIPLGIAAILIQGLVIGYLFPYYYKEQGNPILQGIKFNLIIGLMTYTAMGFATAAKFDINPIAPFLTYHTVFQAIQFTLTGATLGFTFKEAPNRRVQIVGLPREQDRPFLICGGLAAMENPLYHDASISTAHAIAIG